MAELGPLRALHPDPADLAAVIAPPYDVIDGARRAALLGRSAHNVVAIDLPEDGDYAGAAATLRRWRSTGVLRRDPEPALWVLAQTFTGPDGATRTRTGVLGLVATQDYGPGRVRPHERTHSGPKEDRRRLTEATRAQLSPVFALYADATGAARAALERVTRTEPWGEATDDEGTRNVVWRTTDRAFAGALAPAELLIADGHHRYETARALGQPRVLMHLVALEDPGLAVFATHRLVAGRGPERHAALERAVRERFGVAEVALDELAPPPGDPRVPAFGLLDGHARRGLRLTARRPVAITDVDAAVLERELLRGPLALTDANIDHLDGFGYARDAREAVDAVLDGPYDLAFLLRPTPVEQVAAVAGAGLAMPPKSTYFFPKVPTGLLIAPFDD